MKFSIEIQSLFKAALVSLILCVLAATVVYYTSLSESLLTYAGKIILIIGVLLASSWVSKAYGSRGLVRGVTMGLIVYIIILIATLVFNHMLIAWKSSFYILCLCLITGSLGGIIGIGMSSNN